MSHRKSIAFDAKKATFQRARLGLLKTPRGDIQTPFFFFCATKGTIKTLTPEMIDQVNLQGVLSNSYHLMIQPGEEAFLKSKGLHNFMRFHKPILTDSGGYQIFSMGYGSVSSEIKGTKQKKPFLEKITDDGVYLRSYWDGKPIFISAEKMIRFQCILGSDFCVQFDECTPFNMSYDKTKQALNRTMLWGNQSLKTFNEYRGSFVGYPQALYGVLQGGVYHDLRLKSASYILDNPFFGIAIGGSLGQNYPSMFNTVKMSRELLGPTNRPIHLLGIGKVRDILSLVPLGIDSFDSVYPTRLARHGIAIVKGEYGSIIDLRKACYKDDHRPIDPSFQTIAVNRSYIHHLLKSSEQSFMTLLTYHNVMQMNRLMDDIRRVLKIIDSRVEWDEFAKLWDPSLYPSQSSKDPYPYFSIAKDSLDIDKVRSENLYTIDDENLPKDFFDVDTYHDSEYPELYDIEKRLERFRESKFDFYYLKDAFKKKRSDSKDS